MTELNSVFKAKKYIFKKIRNHSLKPGDKPPSNLSIAREVDVRTDGVYEAIGRLTIEQILTDNFEEGTSIKALCPFYYPPNKLFSISEMIKKVGYEASTEYLSLEQQPAFLLGAKMLDIGGKRPVTIIERLRTASHQPVIYCLNKVAEHHLTCAEYQESDGSMLNAIELNTGHKVTSAETEIEAISYEPHISSILDAEPHEGSMLLGVTHYDEMGKPILHSLNYIKSSLMKFKLTHTEI